MAANRPAISVAELDRRISLIRDVPLALKIGHAEAALTMIRDLLVSHDARLVVLEKRDALEKQEPEDRSS